LSDYQAQTPTVRRAIIDALCVNPAAAEALLGAIAGKQLARAELDAARENRLRAHRDPQVARRAKELLTTAPPAERQAVLADYQSALKLAPDVTAGKQLFRQHCAVCHKIGDLGVDVAPDISDSRVKTPEQLLVDILNPNQAIDNNYTSYTVVMADGSVHSGIIGGETASAITLRQQEAKTVELLRADVETIKSTGLSLMPEGFEKQLSQQQLADLISFIKNWRYLEQ
jgi:putative heme-binding domain-containing protein